MKLRRPLTAAVLAVITLLAGTIVASPARADLFHPRQTWLRNSAAGLFLHWGMRTSPGYATCEAWEKAVTDGGWDPAYWVDEARKLHASYLVLASFHSRLGYSRPWPSAIPGSCSTKRDFLGELIKAAKDKGEHVILYMTDDPQWHAEGGHEWLDSAAYSAYKGKTVDLTTRPGFGEFSYDNFVEIMKNYPDLAGFWIDNDNQYWEQNGLYERIRAERPDMLLSNNNEDTPIMDTVSNEQKTGMVPAYDYPAAVWTPMPRLTEADFKLPSKGAWWFDGSNPPVDYRLTLGRYVANAGSSIKNLMAETAMVNGRFPSNQEAFNNFAEGWLDDIWESIHLTEGGGYMYGGLQPGAWNDGAFGYVTVKKDDPQLEYVHVVTKPATATEVKLRDNGYKIVRVTDERTGERTPFEQSGGYLTIKGITNWDQYDTVFRVQTADRQGVYPSESITATATAAKAGFPASNLTDGDYTTYWDADGTFPVSITLDLGDKNKAEYLAINQREWSPTHNRETFGRKEDSARIKDYKLYVSDDGVTWGEPLRAGVMESARAARYIDLGVKTRYIKLEVDSTWAAPTVPAYYHKLRIDEMRVGWRTPVGHDNH
ncbi:discoidin domain-containing protein [Planotetraspora sp. A-T 1434]|uniref:discoidin domain-containing protein n=1 Tax=Planotetraspora sp. A-T 1434 TaxID=2979219 RepID=UPI0021BE9EFE|nr:discoidin domain-containing protein [Planotetraspora sp. A-T 1434]MCT9934287.1 discoidin domain-containing protein [Planotetraspora sp. A-T 1434]